MTALKLGSVELRAGVRAGAPIPLRDGQLIPRAFSLVIQWPSGVQFWNLPIGFDIERVLATGVQRERRVIVDVTRLALIALGLLTAITGTSALRAELKGRINRG
ncbi:MAG: hypothetical protein ACRC1H_07465 [Caldilineaceae bacterium]